jgi:23S rRNA (guanosine2251-2'-O)-methyltransferase
VPAADLFGADEELVAGRRPVEEAFVARRGAIRLLVVPQRRQALERIVLHATNLRIPIVEVEGGTLTALAGFDGHQGVALVVTPRRFASIDDILARAAERGEPPFVLVMDSLEDPQNVGTLLRSAEAAGIHGVIYPTHRQAPLSPAAIKASAGAVEHLLLCPVDDLAASLTDLHVRGLRIVGAEAEAPMTARQADLRGPLAIVVGSEGQGLGPAIRRRADLLMRIPMRGKVGSLNAAVAGSVLLFEALAQRDPGSETRAPEPSRSAVEAREDELAATAEALVAVEDPVATAVLEEPIQAVELTSASAPTGRARKRAPEGAAPKRTRATTPVARSGESMADDLLPGGPTPPAEPRAAGRSAVRAATPKPKPAARTLAPKPAAKATAKPAPKPAAKAAAAKPAANAAAKPVAKAVAKRAAKPAPKPAAKPAAAKAPAKPAAKRVPAKPPSTEPRARKVPAAGRRAATGEDAS